MMRLWIVLIGIQLVNCLSSGQKKAMPRPDDYEDRSLKKLVFNNHFVASVLEFSKFSEKFDAF